jgi:hypothetical protein
MSRAMSKTADGLIGLFGHTFKEEHELEWQFRIERPASEDAYLVQLYSWVDGGPAGVKVLARDVLLSDRCRLYMTAEAMHDAYEAYSRQRR